MPMRPRHDVLVVGEALIDVNDDGMTIRERVGGSAGNVAVGLARLGRDTLLHTAIGRDERGSEISAYLTASGVGLSDSSVSQVTSSVARAVLRGDGSARHDFRIHWEPASDPGTLAARAVHAGSVAAYLEPGAHTVLELVSRAYGQSLITFDPKIEPVLVGADTSMRWLRSGAPVVEQVLARSVQAAALTVARLGAVPPTADELEHASSNAS